jgi:SAM-dependent methyltransferase
MKPFSPSCEQNQRPIYEVLEKAFRGRKKVLELASGTGQHAVFFAARMPDLIWQTSDLANNLPGIREWLFEAALPNTPWPLELSSENSPWPVKDVDAVFCANAVHIMSWPSVERLFQGIGEVLTPFGLLALYGPFNYNGHYTSESNRQFDESLKSQNPASGVRDFEAIQKLAEAHGFVLLEDIEMPANNRTLIWQKRAN